MLVEGTLKVVRGFSECVYIMEERIYRRYARRVWLYYVLIYWISTYSQRFCSKFNICMFCRNRVLKKFLTRCKTTLFNSQISRIAGKQSVKQFLTLTLWWNTNHKFYVLKEICILILFYYYISAEYKKYLFLLDLRNFSTHPQKQHYCRWLV